MLLSCVLVVLLGLTRLGSGQNQDFITLKATCYADRMLVSLLTSEPFEGLLYARNYPSSCRVSGGQYGQPGLPPGQPAAGQPVTQLMLTPHECGIKFGITRKGIEGVMEAEIYVQHDSFVQQVSRGEFSETLWSV